MNTLQLRRNRANSEDCTPELLQIDAVQPAMIDEENFVDLATIRRRVAIIKNRWSAETVRARAAEGARRRTELEGLVENLLAHHNDDLGGEDGGLRVYM